MKHMQKLTCLLLALLMVLSLGITAFAAEGTPDPNAEPELGNITITNAAPGETYKLYKILDLESYKKIETTEVVGEGEDQETVVIDNGQYSYKMETGWEAFFAQDAVKVYCTEAKDEQGNATGYVSWTKNPYTGADVVNFSHLALKYAQDNNNNIDPIKTYECPGEVGGAKVTYTFENLDLGYYLLDSTLGSLCVLTTTNPNVNITDKNAVPTNDKKVQEGSEWKDANDVSIGDTVNFRSFVDFESGIENLIFHDKMDAGLTFNPASVAVVLDPTETKASDKQTDLLPNKHYSVITKKDEAGNLIPLDDGCTFHIEFSKTTDEATGTQDFYKLITAGDHRLRITYSAILNENAVVRGNGNKNGCHLTYGNDNHATPTKGTVTKTWTVPFWKYELEGSNMVGLAGVKFTLSLSSDGSTPIKLVQVADRMVNVTDKDGNVIMENGTEKKEPWRVYRIATEEQINDPTVTKVEKIETGETGKFYISGLDSKTYYLTETDPLDGYQGLDKPLTIVMSNDGTFKKNETTASLILIQNSSGTKMPSTGGIGTTIFYVVGSVLLIGAGVLLVTKKRMSAEA